MFNDDWQLANHSAAAQGSAYIPVKNGIDPLNQALPEAINETDSTINSVITSRLLDRSHGNQPGVSAYHRLWQNAPLFEKLRSRPLKIAHLQHLYFHNERPFQVGNSWGSRGVLQALTWFDRYYFSGLAIHSETDPFIDLSQLNPLWQAEPNRQTLSQLLAQQNQEATLLASRLLARQQFNIHSTSVAAWTAALNGLSYQDWPSVHYTNAEGNGPLSIQQQSGTHAFTRFSQSLAESYQAPVTPVPSDASPIAASEFYRRGLRHCRPSQLKQLATNIVTLLKEKAVPFASMEAFLSPATAAAPSLLESAIAMTFAPQGRQHWDHSWETDGLRGPPETRLDIDHFAPGHLSQADLLAGIGPHLAPRSDTFSIRAFAMTSPAAGTSKIIGLEARLQRTPQTCKLQPTVGRRCHHQSTLVKSSGSMKLKISLLLSLVFTSPISGQQALRSIEFFIYSQSRLEGLHFQTLQKSSHTDDAQIRPIPIKSHYLHSTGPHRYYGIPQLAFFHSTTKKKLAALKLNETTPTELLVFR